MARAGVQQLTLPEIYKMFKTASDEDKVKLMNTYSNLGERLGKWDQDLDYRRLMGDPEALKQRTITEGVSDGLGGLWDYVKMGAGKVSDKVTDLFSTEEPTDEPVKEVPEVVRAQTTGMTLREDPFAQEETMSKEGFPVGQMSREAPTISPQEQVFLRGVGAPVEEEKAKKEVAESPMARRARERLEALNKKHERYATDPNARWSDMYKIDPDRATFDWNRVAPKGGGAASVVQARLEHDAEIDKEIAEKATQLRKDQIDNGWTSTSPEFLERFGELEALAGSKYYKKGKNSFEKMLGMTNKEIDQELSDKKFEFDKQKEVTKIDKDAFDATNTAMKGLMGVKYSVPAKYRHIASSLARAVEDPENINEASIKNAVKAYIESIDDSVVMAHEAKSFADQSLIGGIKANLQLFYDDNIYSPERLSQIWDDMQAYTVAYREGIKNMVASGKDFYTSYGGRNPAVFDAWGDLVTSDAALPAKPDFSVVQPWWDKLAETRGGGGRKQGVVIPTGKTTPPPKATTPPKQNTSTSGGARTATSLDDF